MNAAVKRWKLQRMLKVDHAGQKMLLAQKNRTVKDEKKVFVSTLLNPSSCDEKLRKNDYKIRNKNFAAEKTPQNWQKEKAKKRSRSVIIIVRTIVHFHVYNYWLLKYSTTCNSVSIWTKMTFDCIVVIRKFRMSQACCTRQILNYLTKDLKIRCCLPYVW